MHRIFGNPNSMGILAERVELRLKALDKSQAWLAKAVGMKQQSINALIRKGVKRPRMLREIAMMLETSQAYLLGETDDPSPEPDADFFADFGQLDPAHKRSVYLLVRGLLAKQKPPAKQKASQKPSGRARRP